MSDHMPLVRFRRLPMTDGIYIIDTVAHRASRWGNSLAVRIPKALADQVGLKDGTPVHIAAGADGSIVVRSSEPTYTLRTLVKRINHKNRHAEVLTGRRSGREAW